MKINLILLGAGNSERFNGNKLLTLINNKPMYMHIVDKVLKINFNKIIFVTQYKEIVSQLKNYNIYVVINNHSYLGISNSIKLGIDVDKECDAYMFMVCDQPFLTCESIKNLMHVFRKSEKGIACIEYNGKLGNPAIFSGKYVHELMNLKGDTGGKYVIKQYPEDLVTTQVLDEIELKDIDTQIDLKRFVNEI